MYELTNPHRQKLPACRLIGKRYGAGDIGENGYQRQWSEFWQKGWFDVLRRAAGGAESLRALYEDGDACVAMELWSDAPAYWIGVLAPPQTEAPEGFEAYDISACELGVVWVRGDEGDLYMRESECMELLRRGGDEPATENGAIVCFERYACPRFTQPDAEGKKTLDICFVLTSK